MVFYIFSPLFFASMGLRANFLTHFDLPLVLGLLMVALIAKFIGACIGAYLGGKQGNQAVMIGFGLDTPRRHGDHPRLPRAGVLIDQ
jgi:Kef-type K+ transport system membrane component KefB